MTQTQINMVLSTEKGQIENVPVLQIGGEKKIFLTQRRTQKIGTTHTKNIMKKQRNFDTNQLSNMISHTSKSKQLKSACVKADAVWNDLANDNTEPILEQPEYIWTDQDISMFVGPEPETPTIMILEQPEPCYRFRYGSEAGVVSPLHGVNSSKRVKTFPKIKLMNFVKKTYVKVDIFVSCVTHDDPRPRVYPYLVKNNKRVRTFFNHFFLYKTNNFSKREPTALMVFAMLLC
jgi:hypothetical protein